MPKTNRPSAKQRSIRVTATEWHTWAEFARQQGLTVSAWLRGLAQRALTPSRESAQSDPNVTKCHDNTEDTDNGSSSLPG